MTLTETGEPDEPTSRPRRPASCRSGPVAADGTYDRGVFRADRAGIEPQPARHCVERDA